jgi:hypothetical protein
MPETGAAARSKTGTATVARGTAVTRLPGNPNRACQLCGTEVRADTGDPLGHV